MFVTAREWGRLENRYPADLSMLENANHVHWLKKEGICSECPDKPAGKICQGFLLTLNYRHC
ncbi:hypothetical protein O5624_04505 [Escherichia coli]|nr:hypothetical protein [Escherichia coli]